MIQGTYVSGDACERAQAFRLGYRSVCHHPKEIGVLEPAGFPPSAELGEQLRQLHKAQAEIDRRKAEELARLREIQDRD